MENLISTYDAEIILSRSARTVYRYVAAGKLHPKRINRLLYFDRGQVQALAAEQDKVRARREGRRALEN